MAVFFPCYSQCQAPLSLRLHWVASGERGVGASVREGPAAYPGPKTWTLQQEGFFVWSSCYKHEKGLVGFCFLLLGYLCTLCTCTHMCACWCGERASMDKGPLLEWQDPTQLHCQCCRVPSRCRSGAFRMPWICYICRWEFAVVLPHVLDCSPSSPAPLCLLVMQGCSQLRSCWAGLNTSTPSVRGRGQQGGMASG